VAFNYELYMYVTLLRQAERKSNYAILDKIDPSYMVCGETLFDFHNTPSRPGLFLYNIPVFLEKGEFFQRLPLNKLCQHIVPVYNTASASHSWAVLVCFFIRSLVRTSALSDVLETCFCSKKQLSVNRGPFQIQQIWSGTMKWVLGIKEFIWSDSKRPIPSQQKKKSFYSFYSLI